MPEAPIRLPIRSKPSKRKQGRFKTVTPLLEAGGGSRATSREGSEELEGAVAGGEDVAGDLVDALEGEADVLLAPGVAFSSTRKRRWGRWTNSLHRKVGGICDLGSYNESLPQNSRSQTDPSRP